MLLTVGGSLALAGSASAQQFKVTASGKITSIYNPSGVYNSSVAVGTPYTFSYLFDYSIPTNTVNSNGTSYYYSGISEGATVTFGDYTLIPRLASYSQVVVTDNLSSTQDFFGLFGGNEAATGIIAPYAGWSLAGASAAIRVTNAKGLLSSEVLPPLSVYQAVNLSGATFQSTVTANNYSNTNLEGSVTFLSAELVNPAAVPEASTWVSLGVLLGLGGLGLTVRRRRVMGEGTEGPRG